VCLWLVPRSLTHWATDSFEDATWYICGSFMPSAGKTAVNNSTLKMIPFDIMYTIDPYCVMERSPSRITTDVNWSHGIQAMYQQASLISTDLNSNRDECKSLTSAGINPCRVNDMYCTFRCNKRPLPKKYRGKIKRIKKYYGSRKTGSAYNASILYEINQGFWEIPTACTITFLTLIKQSNETIEC